MALKKGIPEAPLKIYAEKLYTMEELAGVLRCDPRSVYNYRLEGRFKCVRMGGKYLVAGSEILYLKRNGLRPVTAEYRKLAAAVQCQQRAKRRARAAAGEAPAAAKAPTRAHTRTRKSAKKAEIALTSVKTH